VRSPTKTAQELGRWRRPDEPSWPDFRVQHPADLTLKGAELMQRMGTYYRKRWESLFRNACPRNEVFLWADRDERTLMTARALASGLAGGDCTLTISETYEPIDPLFHPTSELKGEGCNFTLPDPPPPSAKQMQAVQEIVDCCQKKFCEETFNKETCELKDVAASEKAKESKDAREFTQSFGEMLLLQYAEGLKGDNYAFGKFPPEQKSKMLELLAIHTQMFDEQQRNPDVARPQGDNLINHLVLAITGRGSEATPPGSMFVVFVGHDTNIANIAGLLGLSWRLPEYPNNDIPPGTALAFEVRKSGDSEIVSAVILGQSPDALRNSTPEVVAQRLPIPDCAGPGGSCSLREFQQRVWNGAWYEKYGGCVSGERPSPPAQ
jgi:4-phytase/acid phosphatase